MTLFELKNIEKIYRNGDVETPALRDVTFTIEQGEFVSLMGPSGSGKSTLLQILGFLDEPSGGTYKFKGKNWNEYSSDEVANVRNANMGFVFQSFNLLARTDVLRNVMLPLWYSRIPSSEWNERAQKAIELVNMTHRINHLPSRLSGGEKQRVAIARALVTNPDVIFADEPTGNLDSKNGENVMRIFEDLHKSQKHTIILITHETDTARHAERMLTIKDGQIVSDKPVAHRSHRGLRK